MARFVQVINNQVVGRYDLLPESWQGNNLRDLSRDELKNLGWYSVEVDEPLGWDGQTHRIVGPEFTIRADNVLEKYSLVELSAEERAQNQPAVLDAEPVLLTVNPEQLTNNPEIAELVNRLKLLTNQ